LCDDSDRVLQESHHDQETSDSWQISVEAYLAAAPSLRRVPLEDPPPEGDTRLGRGLEDIRLDGIAQRIQEILDLAGLLPDGIEGTWIVGHVCARPAKRVLIRDVVTGSPSDLGHCGDPPRDSIGT
jgi:hypothetical protein